MTTQSILSYIKGLSVKLQGRYIDAILVHREIKNVKSTYIKLRSDIEKLIYSQVLLLCQSVGIEESTPRVTDRQQHQQNLPSDCSK